MPRAAATALGVYLKLELCAGGLVYERPNHTTQQIYLGTGAPACWSMTRLLITQFEGALIGECNDDVSVVAGDDAIADLHGHTDCDGDGCAAALNLYGTRRGGYDTCAGGLSIGRACFENRDRDQQKQKRKGITGESQRLQRPHVQCAFPSLFKAPFYSASGLLSIQAAANAIYNNPPLCCIKAFQGSAHVAASTTKSCELAQNYC